MHRRHPGTLCRPNRGWTVNASVAVLCVVALMGLIALSVFGCYVYYPAPAEIFEEMRIVNTEVMASASSQDWDTALYWIPIYDDWTRKLQVSMFLRGEELTPYRRAKATILRDKLELLEHEVEDQEVKESRELGMAVTRAYRRMRAAYTMENSSDIATLTQKVDTHPLIPNNRYDAPCRCA